MLSFLLQLVNNQNPNNKFKYIALIGMSVGIRNLQKSLQAEKSVNNNKQFVAFLNERILGKLINQHKQSNKQTKKKLCIDDINFRNFKKIYRRQKIIQNARYSQMTRNSEQDDLISHRPDWKINRIQSEKVLGNRSNVSLTRSRQCCIKNRQQPIRIIQKFDKIDEDVYKKILSSRPQQSVKNPQVNTLFKHYVQVCELNQNIRRLELTRKKKW